MGKSKQKTFKVSLSERRKVAVNSFKGFPFIHFNDNNKGNHVTFDKKDFKRLIKQSPKILQNIKKVEALTKKNRKRKEKKESESEREVSDSASEASGSEASQDSS